MSTLIEESWAVDRQITNKSNKASAEDGIVNMLERNVKAYMMNLSDTRLDKKKNTRETFEVRPASDDVEEFKVPSITHLSLTDSKNYFTKAQRWIGHVHEIRENSFFAELKDLNDPTTYEVGEFEYDEISPEDRELISLGAAFYWSIGSSYKNGQIEKKSLIRFQRMKPWTEADYKKSLDRAEFFFEKLNLE